MLPEVLIRGWIFSAGKTPRIHVTTWMFCWCFSNTYTWVLNQKLGGEKCLPPKMDGLYISWKSQKEQMGWFGGTTIFGNTHIYIYINEDDYCGHPNVTFWGCFVWVSKYLFLNIERFPGVGYFGAPWPGHWNEAQLDGYCIRWIAWWAHCPKVKQGFNMVSMWPLWAIVSLHPSLEKKQTLVFEVKLDPLDFHNVSNTLWGCFEDGPKPYPRQICSSCIYIYLEDWGS